MFLAVLLYVATAFSDPSLRPFEKDGRFGYVDDSGRVRIEARYILAGDFSENDIAAVVDDSGWVMIDTNGTELLRPYIVDNGPDYFREGLARFVDAEKIGFFDRSGRIIIKARFAYARPFSDSLAAVCEGCTVQREGEYGIMTGGEWGYIDPQGVLVIPYMYDNAEDFREGKARVTISGQTFYIRKNGKRIGEGYR